MTSSLSSKRQTQIVMSCLVSAERENARVSGYWSCRLSNYQPDEDARFTCPEQHCRARFSSFKAILNHCCQKHKPENYSGGLRVAPELARFAESVVHEHEMRAAAQRREHQQEEEAAHHQQQWRPYSSASSSWIPTNELSQQVWYMQEEMAKMTARIQQLEDMRTLIQSQRKENIILRTENTTLWNACISLQDTRDREERKSAVAQLQESEWRHELAEERHYAQESESVVAQLQDTIARLQDDEDTMDTCVACLDHRREVCLLPCAHLVYCSDCADKASALRSDGMITCPMCSRLSVQRVDIFR